MDCDGGLTVDCSNCQDTTHLRNKALVLQPDGLQSPEQHILDSKARLTDVFPKAPTQRRNRSKWEFWHAWREPTKLATKTSPRNHGRGPLPLDKERVTRNQKIRRQLSFRLSPNLHSSLSRPFLAQGLVAMDRAPAAPSVPQSHVAQVPSSSVWILFVALSLFFHPSEPL